MRRSATQGCNSRMSSHAECGSTERKRRGGQGEQPHLAQHGLVQLGEAGQVKGRQDLAVPLHIRKVAFQWGRWEVEAHKCQQLGREGCGSHRHEVELAAQAKPRAAQGHASHGAVGGAPACRWNSRCT